VQRACSRLPGAATHHRLVDAWGNGNHQVGGYCVSHVCACEERRRPRPIGERCTETRPANPRLHCRRARGWHRRRCHQRRVLGRVPRCPRCAGSGYCDNLRPAFPAFRRHADWLHGRGRVLDERLRRPAAQGRLPGLRRLRRSRTGQWGMFLWAVCALLLIPLYMSDVSGSPLKETLKPDLWGVAIQQVSTAKAFLAVAIIAGLTWFFSLLTRKWIWQPVFLALALCTMIPLALDGPSASGGTHDFGVNSLLWHVMATAVWVGGLMALVAPAKRRGPHLALITKRY